MIKAFYTKVCLCTRAPDSQWEPQCKVCAAGPSTHCSPDESKTTKPQEPLNSSFLQAPPPLLPEGAKCTPLSSLRVPTTTQTDQNREKSAGSATRMVSGWSGEHVAAMWRDGENAEMC